MIYRVVQNPLACVKKNRFFAIGFMTLVSVGCGSMRTHESPSHPAEEEKLRASRPAEGGPLGDVALEEVAVSGAAAPQPVAPSAVAPRQRLKRKGELMAEPAWDTKFAEDESDESWRPPAVPNTESYDSIAENRFVSVKTAPLSTFSVDVDTASYSNMRRFVSQGSLPPAGAVRIEELINYFDYDYDPPSGDQPFSVYTELSTAPWAANHKLLHIGLKGRVIESHALPARNLVFLLDVSGSMNDPNKLPLLKRSLSALLETMGEKDTVSMVVYAGASGMVLPPTSAHNRSAISRALDQLEAGGSTNGGEGIELAYRLAERSFRPGGVNRVILATDGDFNVGTTNQSDLVKLVEEKRESGVFLTVLGFGMGNYKDSTLEKLADHGNGNYAYIDSLSEARKVLVEQGGASLVTIAKDVKIQLEMNPAVVGAYRLIGYENRALAAEDFNDDQKDAGEIGAGHTVTALYEILSPEQAAQSLDVDPLKYSASVRSGTAKTRQQGWATVLSRGEPSAPSGGGELATLKLRFKAPQGSRSSKREYVVENRVRVPGQTSDVFRFSAAVASYGMILRQSQYRGETSFEMVHHLAQGALGRDQFGRRREFLQLIRAAASL